MCCRIAYPVELTIPQELQCVSGEPASCERQELLCCWTQQKNYVVPDCVRRIADIGGNKFVETITANQPIELTTYDVFASDINLKRVDFLAGVIDLNKQNFWNCPKLEIKK